MKKSEAEKVYTEMLQALDNAGFVFDGDAHYEFSKDGVEICVRNEKRYKKRGYDVSVFGKFADAEKAISLGKKCNPFSGKHNFLNIELESIEYIISQYELTPAVKLGTKLHEIIGINEDLLNACKMLVAFTDEILPQAGSLCFDVGNLNEALLLSSRAITNAEKAK